MYVVNIHKHANVGAKIDLSNKKVEDLSRELHQQIANTRAEHTKAMKEVEKVNAVHATRITSLEDRANAYWDIVVELENTVKSLTSQVNQLVATTEDWNLGSGETTAESSAWMKALLIRDQSLLLLRCYKMH